MLWWLIICDLHGNFIPVYKHKNPSDIMCCVIAGQSYQCMGMNLKASHNEFNLNCKLISSIEAADSEKTSIYVIVYVDRNGATTLILTN